MESISKTGHKFTGKFAATAVRLGLADPIEDTEDMEVEQVEEMIPDPVIDAPPSEEPTEPVIHDESVNEELPVEYTNELENFPVPMDDLIAESNSETDGVKEEPIEEVILDPVPEVKKPVVKEKAKRKPAKAKAPRSKKAKK